MHLMGCGHTAWEYMRILMSKSNLPAAQYDAWSRRLDIVHDIYKDRVTKVLIIIGFFCSACTLTDVCS